MLTKQQFMRHKEKKKVWEKAVFRAALLRKIKKEGPCRTKAQIKDLVDWIFETLKGAEL